MLISSQVHEKINTQIVNELAASHSYLAMAAYCRSEGLHLLANIFREQSTEEREHAEKFVDYLLDREAPVKIGSVPEPKARYDSILAALTTSYDQELEVSRQIEAIAATADEVQDRTTVAFMDWFITEQIEEVRKMARLKKAAEMAGPGILNVEAYLAHIESKLD